MKQNTTRSTTRPTFTGTSNDLGTEHLFGILELSKSTGIVLATTTDGEQFEIRLVDGLAVRVTGREGRDAVQTVAELINAGELSWRFRKTPYAPNGEQPVELSQLIVSAAFSMVA